MNIVLLQAACGELVEGPNVRVPFGNYSIEKIGEFEDCHMVINKEFVQELNGKLILSNNSTIKVCAKNAKGLTVRFIRQSH